MVDFIQEDIDSMSKELAIWRKESIKYESILKNESKDISNALAPLQAQLDSIESLISKEVG